MNRFFNWMGDGIAIAFIGVLFLSLSRVEFQVCYLIGYVLCTRFWMRHVQMTKFETYTVGLVWFISMFYYGLMVLAYRYQNHKWLFDFTTWSYAAQQRKMQI